MAKIIGIFAKPIGWLLNIIYGFIGNYGISILVLTTLVRLLMLPLYSKQIKYSAAMSDLQPQVKEIQDHYAKDPELRQKKLSELYKKNNIDPVSGCLPLLIQMPIMMGLFSLLRTPLEYITAPEMIAAVHESFLWIPDMCQPDAWILPILAGVTTYLTYLTMPENPEQGGTNTIMKYFFPVMLFLMAKSFPSGLALYWAIFNVLSVIQTVVMENKKKKERQRKELETEVKKNLKKSEQKNS